MNDVIKHLRQAALLQEARRLTDSQLLEGFIARRDEAAFTALVRRHGPMVLGVCRRVLGNHHDAEDALQATFLVLARKAPSLNSRELVGPWLYGVAYRTALRAREMNARRRAKEEQAREAARRQGPADDGWQEWLPLLDQELNGLPEHYRVAVVLCDLEGVPRREAARRLNLPEGTLSGRLTRGRRLLAKRLARYGLAVSAGALAVALSAKTASACVAGALAASTARAAVLVAAGEALTAVAVPARVVALTEGVVKTMLLTKLRAFVAVAVLAFVGAGVVWLAYPTTAAEPGKPGGVTQSAAGAQAATDDLDALRLEVEALRKGLQATRERVVALEAEVQALKAPPRAGGVSGNVDTTRSYPLFGTSINTNSGLTGSVMLNERNLDVNPLAEAEAALKKLKEHPDDKQAAEALEKAVQRLKERPKPEGQTGQPGERK